MDQDFILTHLGEHREKYFQAVAPPIVQSSNFAFPELNIFREAFQDELASHLYTRGNNPTVAILREKVAALEKAEDALIFGSGSAAISAAVVSQVQAGDHIVCVEAPYSWTTKLLTQFLGRFGVTHTFVDGCDLAAIEAAIRPETKVLYLESPLSITMQLQDLRACAQLAKKHDLISIIDNSHCSPIYQNPIEMGIDIVLHSATKYLNGHSDVVAGVVCSTKAIIKQIFDIEYMTLGAIISPNDASLMIRGLRTLPLRLQRSNDSAAKIVEWMRQHPAIEKIYHPFSSDFPQYELAQRQMRGNGGLFSVELKAEKIEQVEDVFHRLKRFLFAVSWGGYESLVMPFCAFHNIPDRDAPPYSWRLIRFYIGLENPDWLIEDLEQALQILE